MSDPDDVSTWPYVETEADLGPYMEGDLGIKSICLSAAEDAVNTGERIDWEDLMDEILKDIEDCHMIDLGSSADTPAIARIELMTRKFVREFREVG